MDRVRITPTDTKTARAVVERWHYSRRMPQGAKLLYACHEVAHDGSERFVGVIVLGLGVAKSSPVHDLPAGQHLELQRIAMRDHEAPVTQYVAALIARLKQHQPQLRLLVSFADPYQGHHGGSIRPGAGSTPGRARPRRSTSLPTARSSTAESSPRAASSSSSVPRLARGAKRYSPRSGCLENIATCTPSIARCGAASQASRGPTRPRCARMTHDGKPHAGQVSTVTRLISGQ
jgi:hypothetical protein